MSVDEKVRTAVHAGTVQGMAQASVVANSPIHIARTPIGVHVTTQVAELGSVRLSLDPTARTDGQVVVTEASGWTRDAAGGQSCTPVYRSVGQDEVAGAVRAVMVGLVAQVRMQQVLDGMFNDLPEEYSWGGDRLVALSRAEGPAVMYTCEGQAPVIYRLSGATRGVHSVQVRTPFGDVDVEARDASTLARGLEETIRLRHHGHVGSGKDLTEALGRRLGKVYQAGHPRSVRRAA